MDIEKGQLMRRRPFNCEIVKSNISEAIEELQMIEERAVNKELCEEEFQTRLQHAYHHLNSAWNARRVSNSMYSKLTVDQFNAWGTYPAEIEELEA